MKKYFIGTFLFALLVLSTSVLAQTQLDPNIYDENGFRKDQNISQIQIVEKDVPSSTTTPNPNKAIKSNSGNFIQGEAASCFDYYTFGSIKVNLTNNKSTYELGDAIRLSGQITNENKYPITNLTVRARLVRDIPNPEYLRSEIITVEDFNIVENISLGEGKSFDVNYSKVIPFNAPEGEYKLLFYAYNNDRFNQSGLSFTNDVVASRLSFDINGDAPQHIYLDQTRITLNDKEHNVMAFITNHQKDAPINITIPLVNPSDEDEDMKVTYILYKWDGLRSENIVDTKTQKISVPANEEVQLTYIADNTDTSVYFLTISADNQTSDRSKSVYSIQTQSNIRFSVNGYDFPRVNSFGVNKYPIKANEETTLFTCYHNGATQQTLDELNIKTQVIDNKGKVVSETEYQGKISGSIEAIIKKFTTKKDLVNFSVVTTITDKSGNTIDKIESQYSCESFDPTLCPKPNDFTWIWLALGLLVLVGLIVLMLKAKHRIPTVMFIIMVLFVSLLSIPQESEGAVVTAPFNLEFGIFDIKDQRLSYPYDPLVYVYPDQLIPNTAYSQYYAYPNFWKNMAYIGGSDGYLGGSFSKEVNFLKNGENQASSFVLNLNENGLGETAELFSKPTSGSWFVVAADNDSPPMDGLLYLNYACNTQTCAVNNYGSDWNVGSWFDSVSVSVPLEKGQIEISSDNESVVSCDTDSCTAVSPGTANITIDFNEVNQNSSYDYTCGIRNYSTYVDPIFCFRGNLDPVPTVYTNPNGTKVYASVPYDDRYYNNGFWEYDSLGFGMVNVFLSGNNEDYADDHKSVTFSFPSITYTITVPPVANTPPTTSCLPITTTDNSATISWNYNDVDGDLQSAYQVMVATSSDFSSDSMFENVSGSNSNTSIVVSGLQKDVTYYAKIKTIDSTGKESDWTSNCDWFETNNSTPFTASCRIESPTGAIYKGEEVTFSVNKTGGYNPISYIWNDNPLNSSETFKKIFSSAGDDIEVSLNVSDIKKRERVSVCKFDVNATSCGTAVSYSHSSAPTSNLCLPDPATQPTPIKDGSEWTWDCDGVAQKCRAPVNSTPDAPEVKLKIQPKIAPNCVAQLVDNNGNSKPNILKGDEFCKLTGPSGYTESEYNESDLLSKKVEIQGLYTLKCYATSTPDAVPKISTDVCISNPTTIER